MVIPFTSRAVLLCHHDTRERARGAQSPPPWQPGLPAVNRRFADYSPHPWGSPLRGQRKRCSKLLPAILSSSYSFRLTGTGAGNVPVKQRPRRTSLCVAPASSQRLSDLQPDQGIAVGFEFFAAVVLLCSIGPLSLRERVRVRGNMRRLSCIFALVL